MIRRLLSSAPQRTGAALVTLLLVAFTPLVQADSKGVPGSTAGPDDDLGTLPVTQGPGGPGATAGPDDDLGTLPLSKGNDPAPTLTFTGPASTVSSLLASVRGGDVSTQPGPAPGEVTVHLQGALRVALRYDDPRLATVRVAFHAGELPGLGRLRAGAWSSEVFGLEPGQELVLPVRALVERPDVARRMQAGLNLDALSADGQLYSLGLRAEGAFLILDQSSR